MPLNTASLHTLYLLMDEFCLPSVLLHLPQTASVPQNMILNYCVGMLLIVFRFKNDRYLKHYSTVIFLRPSNIESIECGFAFFFCQLYHISI